MNDLSRILLNLHSLRMFARTLTPQQLEDIYRKLTIVVAESREYDSLLKKKQRIKEKQLRTITKRISDSGLAPDEVISALTNQLPNKRKQRPPKYKYVDGWGKERTWTGQGRMPNTIQNAIKKGEKTLNDFSI